jgi:3-hydroxyisobutyrate dehydrogenase-like beta-hydroxyacid dehydrogenase
MAAIPKRATVCEAELVGRQWTLAAAETAAAALARDFAPHGYARQLRKDLHMVGEYAGQLGTPTPMLDEALALYDRLVEAGHAELDTSAVFKLYDERAI